MRFGGEFRHTNVHEADDVLVRGKSQEFLDLCVARPFAGAPDRAKSQPVGGEQHVLTRRGRRADVLDLEHFLFNGFVHADRDHGGRAERQASGFVQGFPRQGQAYGPIVKRPLRPQVYCVHPRSKRRTATAALYSGLAPAQPRSRVSQ
ncbi:MAG: hypothetical protein MZV64_23210 [Ignavibacteriales bacterium]|nr:hypothetical protein [Ignavibacteriales bacterium]